ncbi:MAG: MMPL family transporter [Acidimicrobiia bacterium]|nr:MMPL family transporter [Acidimicrobiia bacterium]
MFRSLARWCFRHRWLVVGLWLVALVGVNAIGASIGAANQSGFETPASESTAGLAILNRNFPGSGGGRLGGSIVFKAAAGVQAPEVQAAMTELFGEVGTIGGVAVISPYDPLGTQQISADGKIAFAEVNLSDRVSQTEAGKIGARIRRLAPKIDGLQVEVGGNALGKFQPPESELIGLAFAIVVLILAFGSVLAMGLPIGVALAGVGTGGFGLVALLSHVISVPDFASLIGLMIGLGVGIDYALFIVTRYRELAHAGLSAEDATAGAMDTAGRAVLFAGITVVVSLLGMLLIGLKFVSGLGIAAAVTVAITLLASITLLPALLGLAHGRMEVTRWRGLIAAGFAAVALLGIGLGVPALGAMGGLMAAGTILASFAVQPLRREVPARRQKPIRETFAYRWSRVIQSQPWASVFVGAAILGLLAAPVFGLRLGFSDEGNAPAGSTTRKAYELVATGFGKGFNGPLLLAVQLDQPGSSGVVPRLATAVAADPGVDRVVGPFPSNRDDPAASKAYVIRIIPTTSPQDKVTTETVNRLRTEVVGPIVKGTGVEADLAGAVATNVDFTDYLSQRIPVFFAAVLGISFLLLMMVFRSLLVPLKAVIMNMFSIAAAYGAVVAIFQWGWFGSLTGIEPAPIEPFVPMMLFAIVFGLSMDYEVFLLSRVKEEYDRTGDPKRSVADGLAATARVITAAAAIMVVVFGAFLLEDNRNVQLFGTGLALAVLLDATLVRMLLVPATMELLGSKNWWIPVWLDRILPRLNVEGGAVPGLHAGVDEDSQPDPDDDPQPVPAGSVS